jgi:hypothetical protein
MSSCLFTKSKTIVSCLDGGPLRFNRLNVCSNLHFDTAQRRCKRERTDQRKQLEPLLAANASIKGTGQYSARLVTTGIHTVQKIELDEILKTDLAFALIPHRRSLS